MTAVMIHQLHIFNLEVGTVHSLITSAYLRASVL